VTDVEDKFDLIVDHERRLARAIAYAAIPRGQLSVWDMMIPFVFIAGHLRLKEKREHCVQNLLFTKTLALEAARAMAVDGTTRSEALKMADAETRKVLASADKRIYANAVRERQMTEISLLTDHYHGMLTASGDSCARLIKATYGNYTALNRFLSRLREAERRVAQAAHQILREQAHAGMGQRIERCSNQIRQNWAVQVFGRNHVLKGNDAMDKKRPRASRRIRWRKRISRWFGRLGDYRNTISHGLGNPDESAEARRWKLLQVEPALACNLRCVMCPWQEIRKKNSVHGGIMSPETWEAIRPHLPQAAAVDFTGGGEPLLQPCLVDWISQAHQAGCQTGLLTNATLLTPEKASALLNAGIDWIGISMDGADAGTYEQIRRNADFHQVCRQVKAVSALRTGQRPKLMLNFVLMGMNTHQLEQMVQLALNLGVDQLNFKQCDVIRGSCGQGLGVFGPAPNKSIRQLESRLAKARRKAKKSGLHTTAFAFTPEVQPVCDQDPTTSMFVRHDGVVGPCINQVLGGPTAFLGRKATMPTLHYGRLGPKDLLQLWGSAPCRAFRQRFRSRIEVFDAVFARRFIEGAAGGDRTETEARRSLPSPADGCRDCHYLYNV
jgi:MoaA/NifB/PqqE/SkfB family radical SAM enzyme